MDFVFHFNCSSAFVQFFCKILFVFNCILLTEFLYDVLSNNSTQALRGRKKEWFTFIDIEYYDNKTNRNKIDGIIKVKLSYNNNTLFI